MKREQIEQWCEDNLFGDRVVDGVRIPLAHAQLAVLRMCTVAIEQWEKRPKASRTGNGLYAKDLAKCHEAKAICADWLIRHQHTDTDITHELREAVMDEIDRLALAEADPELLWKIYQGTKGKRPESYGKV